MQKYMVRSWTWSPKIKAVKIERETEACVWIDGRKHSKKGGHEKYFDTWSEAHAFLIRLSDAEITGALARLEEVNGYRRVIDAMSEVVAATSESGNAA